MNNLERKAAEVQLGVLKLQHLLLKSQLEKGDLPGHPFRGNQYGGGGEGGKLKRDAENASREAEAESAKANKQNTSEAHYDAVDAHGSAESAWNDLRKQEEASSEDTRLSKDERASASARAQDALVNAIDHRIAADKHRKIANELPE